MADKKISALTELTSVDLAGEDLLPVVDSSAAETKKLAISSLENNLVGGSTSQVQFNDGSYFNGDAGLTFDKESGKLTIGGKTVTTSNPVIDATQTWNAAGVTFTGFKLNITDNASFAASSLMDLQIGSVSYFSLLKSGRLKLTGQDQQEIEFLNSANLIFQNISSLPRLSLGTDVGLGSNGRISWKDGAASNTGTSDLLLLRDATQTLAQRNGTNPQVFRLYNTYTDASNYERGKIEWASNVLRIGTEKAGTGSARALEFQTDGTTRLTIGASGGVTSSNFLVAGAASYLGITSQFYIDAVSSGVITFRNWAGTDFNRLQFGGTTSSFPALKRSSTALQVRLADDSADAPLSAGAYQLGSSGITTDATTTRTLSAADNGKVIYFTSDSAITVNTATGLGAGFSCTVIQGGLGQITVTAASGTSVVSYGSFTKTAGRYAAVSILCPVADTFYLNGDLA